MSVVSTGGRQVPVAASLSLIPGRRGAPGGVAIIFRDVSDKRALEAVQGAPGSGERRDGGAH